MQLIIVAQLYIIALSFGVYIPIHIFLIFHFAAGIVALAPITIGGLGLREGALVIVYSLYGIGAEKALVISLVGYLITGLLPSFYGLIVAMSDAVKTGKSQDIKARLILFRKNIREKKKITEEA